MPGSTGGDDLELSHYVGVLRRRKLVIVVTILVALVAGFAFVKLSTPVYTSTAQVLLQPSAASSDSAAAKTSSGGAGPSATPEIASQVAIILSSSVADDAKQALHLTDLSVSAAPVGNSNVVGITASAGSAKEAARVAQTYAETYVAKHGAQVTADLKTTTDGLAAQIRTIEGQLVPLDQSLSDLNTRIEATTVASARAPLAAQRDQVTQQRQTLDTRRGDLQQRLDRLQLDAAATNPGGVEIVSKATVPSAPSSPQKVRDMALALALGVIGGIAAAFVRDHLDDRIKSPEDLRQGTDRPVLGLVPTVRGWHRSDPPLLVTEREPQSAAGEAYARLATVLDLKGATAKLQIIQIISPGLNDGKTTTAANLGVAFAQAGRQVVVVDANLRRPRLHRFFGLENYRGLTSVLRGEVSLADALVDVDGEPSLRILPSGPIPPNPAELLAGQNTRDLITRLRFEGHLVIVDGPSLLIPDAMVLADRVDGVLLVAYLNHTTCTNLAQASALLEHIDTPFVGTILNGTGRKTGRDLASGLRRARVSQDSYPEVPPAPNGAMPSATEPRVTANK